MCSARTSTVMTTILQLRMALRKGNFAKTKPLITRDPTYSKKQSKDYVQMPSMVDRTRTSNTFTAPPALNQILRGDVLQAQAIKKDLHQEHLISIQAATPDATGNSDEAGKQTMWVNKRCRMDTALMGTNITTSVKNCDDQDPDPMAKGIELVTTSGIDKDGGLKNGTREAREYPETQQPIRNGRANPHSSNNPNLPCTLNHPS